MEIIFDMRNAMWIATAIMQCSFQKLTHNYVIITMQPLIRIDLEILFQKI